MRPGGRSLRRALGRDDGERPDRNQGALEEQLRIQLAGRGLTCEPQARYDRVCATPPGIKGASRRERWPLATLDTEHRRARGLAIGSTALPARARSPRAKVTAYAGDQHRTPTDNHGRTSAQQRCRPAAKRPLQAGGSSPLRSTTRNPPRSRRRRPRTQERPGPSC